MKKAIIDQIMLGVFIFIALIVFGATVADEMQARNKYYNLKKLTDITALAMANYYNDVNENTTEAEAIANAILDETKLGAEIKGSITYTWDLVSDPKSVISSIPNYSHTTFWYQLLGKADFALNAESKANLVDKANLDTVDAVDDYVPFAINECGQDGITPDDQFSFIYKAYDLYDANEGLGFYGLDGVNPNRLDGSQSGFAHFKNEVTSFDRTTTDQYLVDSDQTSIENDAQQLASELEVHKFNDVGTPWEISIALLDCSSTKDNIIINNLIPVTVDKIYCGDKATSETNINAAFNDDTGEVFNDITWVDWVDEKDCSQSGLFRMDITISAPQEAKLEY